MECRGAVLRIEDIQKGPLRCERVADVSIRRDEGPVIYTMRVLAIEVCAEAFRAVAETCIRAAVPSIKVTGHVIIEIVAQAVADGLDVTACAAG